jgi:hypothetical protein
MIENAQANIQGLIPSLPFDTINIVTPDASAINAASIKIIAKIRSVFI